MSIITFQCYSCQATLKVGADKAGKKAKCRCGTVLTIPAAAAEAVTDAPPGGSQSLHPTKRPAKTALSSDPPFEDEPPAKKRSKLDMDEAPARARNGRGRDDDDELDDDEDRPRKRRRDEEEDDLEDDRPRKKRRRDDDDEFDDDDRPRKKRRRDDEDDDLDDDRPSRKRRRDEEDDEDDRPSRKRKRDDDYEDDDDRPRRRRGRDDDEDDRPRRGKSGGEWKDVWPRVRLGFMLAFIGAIVYAAGLGLDRLPRIIGMIMGMSGGGSMGLYQTLGVFTKIGVLVAMGGLITGIVGYVFWIFVTNKNGALAFAIATLATSGLNVIFNIIFQVVPAFRGGLFRYDGDTATVIILNILETGAMTAVWILAALYMRAIATNLKDRALGSSVTLMIIVASVAGGLEALSPLIMLPFHGVSAYGIVNLILTVLVTGAQVFQLVLFILAFKNARQATDL